MLPVLYGLNRESLGKNFSRRSRKAGHIPAVVYQQQNNQLISLENEATRDILKEHGDNALVELKIGEDLATVVIKEVQRHPISGEILHIDFIPIDTEMVIRARIPIGFINTGDIIKKHGTIQVHKNNIDIKCKAKDIPKVINIDASKHKLGEAIKIGEIELAGEISIVGNGEDIIATFTLPKNTEVPDAQPNKKE